MLSQYHDNDNTQWVKHLSKQIVSDNFLEKHQGTL